MKVGAATIVDIRTAEVAVGQAQVNQVTAHNQAVIDKIRLFQYMGVPADTAMKLTTKFAISSPTSRSTRCSVARQRESRRRGRRIATIRRADGRESASMSYLPIALGQHRLGWQLARRMPTRTYLSA